VAAGVLGKDTGLLMVVLAQIEATGLTAQQINNIGNALLAYIKGVADPSLVTQIIGSVPGLKQHFVH
jgi:hypothetical protein